MRCQTEQTGGAYLESSSPRCGFEAPVHLELRCFFVPPPTGQSRLDCWKPIATKEISNRAGAAVQILITATEGGRLRLRTSCAGYTVWSGLRWAEPQPNESVAVVGTGGLPPRLTEPYITVTHPGRDLTHEQVSWINFYLHFVEEPPGELRAPPHKPAT